MLHLSSRNNSRRKQADDSEESLNARKKKRNKPPENGVQDVNSTERHNSAMKEKLSFKDSKKPGKEPKIAKQVREKQKPNLPTSTVAKNNKNVESLPQEGRKSTTALALTSTVVNTQLSKSSKPSKVKSNMEDKTGNPSWSFSSKANLGKRKSNLDPVKTNSKKSKTNDKGKDIVTGKKTVNGIVIGKRNEDGDASSSESSEESSSSTKSSSESTDESGPSNSHSKVNGIASPAASAELINNDKSPLHERLGKGTQLKIGKDSSQRKTGKDKNGIPLKLHTDRKGNDAIKESSSSSDSSTDTDKTVNAIKKHTKSSSSSSLSSGSSSESKREKAKVDNNKGTSSSLLHPLLSSPSSQSFPSPSLLRGIRLEDANETSVNQSPIHAVKEKISLFGQKQDQQSTSKWQNKKTGKIVYGLTFDLKIMSSKHT